ncbi:MAG: histidine phosphatase family protein [Pseudomonadota bacterium]
MSADRPTDDQAAGNASGPRAVGRRRIYLMRHGHVDYFDPGLTDPRLVDLTDEGRAQATAAAAALRPQPFDAAFCSGLPRARQTAEIVLAAHDDRPALHDHAGLEELKSGWIQATSREELGARLAFCFDDADAPGARFLPDGELFVDAQARVTQAIGDIVMGHAWKNALVVAHEGVNRLLLAWACGGGLATVRAFEQDLCCVNVIDIDVTPAPGGAGRVIERSILKAVNLTPYDYVKGGLPRTSLEHLFGIDFGGLRPARDVA